MSRVPWPYPVTSQWSKMLICSKCRLEQRVTLHFVYMYTLNDDPLAHFQCRECGNMNRISRWKLPKKLAKQESYYRWSFIEWAKAEYEKQLKKEDV